LMVKRNLDAIETNLGNDTANEGKSHIQH